MNQTKLKLWRARQRSTRQHLVDLDTRLARLGVRRGEGTIARASEEMVERGQRIVREFASTIRVH